MKYFTIFLICVSCLSCKTILGSFGKDEEDEKIPPEAFSNTKALCDGAVAYARDKSEPSFPVASTSFRPISDGCCNGSIPEKCNPGNIPGPIGYSQEGVWSAEPWKSLKFEMRDPHFFVYKYVSDGKKMMAISKLSDCKSGEVYFYCTAEIQDGRVSDPSKIKRSDTEPKI
jgi:hypothetical protein